MLRILSLILLGLFSIFKMASAASLTITADFTPTVSAPYNISFINTTPQSGFCVSDNQRYCADGKLFSIALPVNADITRGFVLHDKLSFRMPTAWREISVVNRETGESHSLKFAVQGAGFYARGNTPNKGWSLVGDRDSLFSAPPGCTSGSNGGGFYGGDYVNFFWLWSGKDNARCERTNMLAKRDSLRLSNNSIMYQLETPNPLLMGDGIYEGTLTYSVAGSGADIELGGELFETSDDTLNINFYLTVTHELSVTSQDTDLTLHACQQGKICSKAQNAANWERAFVSNIAPALTAKSDFSLFSTGSFTVHISCEFNVGDDCGMQSEKTQQTVPLKASLTLPGNIVDASGRPVRDFALKNSKDIGRGFFRTATSSSAGQKGSVHFEVAKRDVEIMQRNAPDNYHGVVTLNFDPNVWY